jgi:hypothetical protein
MAKKGPCAAIANNPRFRVQNKLPLDIKEIVGE